MGPPLWVAAYMEREKRWPEPPIVIDNRDGLIDFELMAFDIPQGFVVVEGHKRVELAMALIRRGELANDLRIWVLSYPTVG